MTTNPPPWDKICLLDPLGRTKRRKAVTKAGVTQNEPGGDDGNIVALRWDGHASKLEVTQNEGKWEEEQRGESDMEEEEDHQEDSSIEEGDGERQCSVYDTGVSVVECEDCHIPLHESCSSSLTPFLCDFFMRKKRLREQECKTDTTSDREESEEEGEGGDILEIYSASTSSSDE